MGGETQVYLGLWVGARPCWFEPARGVPREVVVGQEEVGQGEEPGGSSS